MGKVSNWLESQLGFSNPAKDLDRILGCINRIAIDAEHLDNKPTDSVRLDEIETLQREAADFRKNLTAALARNPRYRPLATSASATWRLHAARDVLTAAEVRLEALRGRIQADTVAIEAVHAHESERGRIPANARWARLDAVKDWAFQQRRDDQAKSRAAVIKRILPEIKERAKSAGETLSGADDAVIRTVTRWFRDAGIK